MTRSMLPSLFGRGDEPIGSLFREVERVFDDFARNTPFAGALPAGRGLVPRIDVAESPDAFEITAELPGISEKDVEITVSRGVLTIRGEKKLDREEKGKDWQVVERSHGAFQRSIALGFDPEIAKVEAKFDKGVLSVRVPKPAEEARAPKKVTIKTS